MLLRSARNGTWREPSRRARLGRGWLLIAAAAAAACHGSNALTPATSGTIISIVDQPPGTKASAVIAGPNDYAVFAPPGVDTFSLLPLGTYTMSDPVAVASDPIVTPSYAGTLMDSSATLTDGDTVQMSASFAVIAGSGRVWVGSSNGSSSIASGYTSTQLTTPAAAGVTLAVAGAYEVLDDSSDLWVADSAGNTLSEYPAASLGRSGSPAAAVTITSGALDGPVGLVFDRAGDLWIANSGNSSVVEFTASQLKAGGSVTPAVTLTSGSIGAPGRIAFDAYGNLWVPNLTFNTVVGFSASQLAASGAPTAAITLSAVGTSLVGPRAVAFDQQGDLWVANLTGNTIVAYGNSQQTASGSPVPIETLSVPSASGAPSTLAFDNSGDMWILSAVSPTVLEYTAQQISAGAASQPGFSLQVPSKPASLVFDPPPNGLPLAGPQADRHIPRPAGGISAGSRLVRVRRG